MKATLDMNCIVALEENESDAEHVAKLLKHHDLGNIKLQLLAINASELQKVGGYAASFSDYQRRLVDLGVDHLGTLKPLGYVDVTFWDYCLVADEEMIGLEESINEILFPGNLFKFSELCSEFGFDPEDEKLYLTKEYQAWRNQKCDVLGMWSHIFHGGDVFVTSDKNFHQATKKPALIDLGAGEILTPNDLATKLDAEHCNA